MVCTRRKRPSAMFRPRFATMAGKSGPITAGNPSGAFPGDGDDGAAARCWASHSSAAPVLSSQLTSAKPAAPKHAAAAAKHDTTAKPAEKPAASSGQKPAKPKAATKPPAKPANNS